MARLRDLFRDYPVDIDKCTPNKWDNCPLAMLGKAISPDKDWQPGVWGNRTLARNVLVGNSDIPDKVFNTFFPAFDRHYDSTKSRQEAFKLALDEAEPIEPVNQLPDVTRELSDGNATPAV